MPSRRGPLLAIAVGAAAAAFGASALHRSRRAVAQPLPARIAETSIGDDGRWPSPSASVRRVSAAAPPRVIAVTIDPGHGAHGNRGNNGSFCLDEQDTMMDLAVAVSDRLQVSGRFVVRLAREPGETVDYVDRLRDAANAGSDAFVSFHSDVRGHVDHWSPAEGLLCPIATDAAGFAVLYSDEGEADVTAPRLRLGRSVARRMLEAGFAAYGGVDYVGLYDADRAQPGVFVDRHPPDRRIFLLRRASMPAVLVETHNALDPREASRWTSPDVLDAFASALAAALRDALGAGS